MMDGGTQVVDRDEGCMAVTPDKQSLTVLWISLYVEVLGGTTCSFLTFLLCIMEMCSVLH